MIVQPGESPDQEIVFRLDRSFRRPLIGRGIATLIFGGLLAGAGVTLGPQMYVIGGLFGAFAAMCGVAYVWRGRFRTVLTPRGIRSRGYFSRFVPWSAIAGFQVRSHGPARSSQEDGHAGPIVVPTSSMRGRRITVDNDRRPPKVRVVVQVVRVNGHRLTLRAPVVTGWSSDCDFDDKVRLMQEWQHRYGAPPAVTAPGAIPGTIPGTIQG